MREVRRGASRVSLSRHPARPLVAPPGNSGPRWTVQLKAHGPKNVSFWCAYPKTTTFSPGRQVCPEPVTCRKEQKWHRQKWKRPRLLGFLPCRSILCVYRWTFYTVYLLVLLTVCVSAIFDNSKWNPTDDSTLSGLLTRDKRLSN